MIVTFFKKVKKSQSSATVAAFQWTYQNIKEFIALKDRAFQYGIGGFSLKLFRLAKSSAGKCKNFAIVTDGQWQL